MRTTTEERRGLLNRREIKRLSFVSQKLHDLFSLLSHSPFGEVKTRGCNGGTKKRGKKERKKEGG